MTSVELDPQFILSLKLLHSTNKDSADQLRNVIDEIIRQKYGPSKMLCNVLHKRYMIEEATLNEHTSSSNSSKKKSSSSSSSKHSSKSSKSNSPVNIQSTHDNTPEILQSDDTLALEILEDDLTCVTCKGMDVGARNRLVECAECHSLYHQECHIPHILDSQIDVPRCIWYCSKCSKESQISKERTSPKLSTSESKSKDSKKSSKKQTTKSQKSSSKKIK